MVEAHSYPVSYKGQYHYRSGSTKQELKGVALDQFILKKQGKHWDGVPIPGLSVEDLDSRIINSFRSTAVDRQRLDEISLDEPLDLLLTKYTRAMISYKGTERLDVSPVPRAALREALHNAIVHKDYGSSIPIQISVYENKIMIWNSGILPEGWDLKKLTGKHSSIPFNPDIADTFFRVGKIESWGRGIERIFDACMDAGVPRPEYQLEKTGLWTIFNFSQDHNKEIGSEKSSPESSHKTADRILTFMKENPEITTEEIAHKIGISKRAIIKQTEKLKNQGKLKRVGPNKGGHWEVLK